MYNNDNNHYPSSNHNGNYPSMKPIWEEPDSLKLENQNLEKSSQSLGPQAKHNLQQLWRFYIILIVTGLLVGGLLSWGLVTVLNEWNMLEPPKEERLNQD